MYRLFGKPIRMKSETQIYSFLNLRAPHLETMSEIAIKESEAGAPVSFYFCNQQIVELGVVECSQWGACQFCTKRVTRMREILSKKDIRFLKLPLVPSTAVPIPDNVFQSKTTFMNFKHGGFDVGKAVASTLISAKREPEFLSCYSTPKLRKILSSSILFYDQMKAHLKISRPKKVLVFTGRLTPDRAVYQAAKELKIPVEVIELGGQIDRYLRLQERTPHDEFDAFTEISRIWDSADERESQKIEIGRQWFEMRRYDPKHSISKHAKALKKGFLPLRLEPEKKRVSILISSDDERMAAGNSKPPRDFSNQLQTVKNLLLHFEDNKQIEFVVRMHPHLRDIENSQVRTFQDLKNKSVQIIQAASSIDTYALVESSDLAISFWSSMGIEATFWKNASAVLCPTTYSSLDSCYKPKSLEELYSLVKNPPPPKPQIEAIKFGFWQMKKGEPYEYWKPRDNRFFSGKFLDQSTLPSKTSLLIWRLVQTFQVRYRS